MPQQQDMRQTEQVKKCYNKQIQTHTIMIKIIVAMTILHKSRIKFTIVVVIAKQLIIIINMAISPIHAKFLHT